MPRDPGLQRQQPRRPMARLPADHPGHRDALPAGRGPAGLHAPVLGREDDRHAGSAAWTARVPQHAGRWLQERPRRPERHDTARRALPADRRVHLDRQAAALRARPDLARGQVLPGAQPEADAIAAGAPPTRGADLGLLSCGYGGRPSDRGDGGAIPRAFRADRRGQRPNGIETGIRVGIVARDTAEAAWDVAHRRFPKDRKGQLAQQLATKVSDSHWHHRLSELDERPGAEDSPYWLGPFQNYKTFCPYLVGSYRRVAEELAAYVGLGFKTFVLDIPHSKEELDHVGIVFQEALGREGG
jgi:hypothetical protein